MTAGRIGVAVLALGCALALASPVSAASDDRLCAELSRLIDAQASGLQAEVERVAVNNEAVWDGPLLELQVRLLPGVKPSAITDQALASLGGRAGVRAIDMMNVWLRPGRVRSFIHAHRQQVAFVQLPWRPHLLAGGLGPTESQGRDQMVEAPEELTCVGNTGKGVTVAVIDGGFEKLDKSIEKGEVKEVSGNYSLKGGTHGTMCVEVVADMAPGANIRAVSANSYAVMQQFKAEMKMGNPNKVDIVSHSVIWLGMSFGRHGGPACEVTDMARAQGVVWVNASGNSGNGNFHRGIWTDSDGDKKHEFSPGEPTLKFKQNWGGGQIKLTLDWDDYKARKVDLDLYVFRQNKDGFLEEVGESRKKQGPYTPPVEQVIINKPGNGVFAVVLVANTPVPKGMAYRMANLGGGAGSFSIWHKSGNVYDPGSCEGVLTVGAIHHSRYKEGPQEAYSSFGPTIDGRLKPEVMAPTGVATSVGNFGGTSCACPHAAGALALYRAATDANADDLVARLIEDAEPMGETDPSQVYGHGRVVVRSPGAGWQCWPDEQQACGTPCGTTGTQLCDQTCGWQACAPPPELCDDVDNNCDGVTDEDCPVEPVDAGPTDAPDTVVAVDVDTPADVQEPTTKPKPKPDSGCGASRRSAAPPMMLLVCVVALLARRRRVQRT